MPTLKLLPTHLHALPSLGPKGTVYRDTEEPGLALRVYPTGTRTWVVIYHFGGRHGPVRRYKLGPLGKRLGLAAARKRARQVLAQVTLGVDPQEERTGLWRERRGRGAEPTVAGLVGRYVETAMLAPTTVREWRRMLAKEIAAKPIGSLPAASATRGQIRDWGLAIAARSSSTARHAHELLQSAYAWGVRQELVPASPMVHLDSPGPRRHSSRVLSPMELRALLRALRRFGSHYAEAVEMLLLTLARKSMVLGMRRGELEDLQGANPRWIVPSDRVGLKRRARAESPLPHVVPLGPRAVAIVCRRLQEVQREEPCLFPKRWSRRGTGGQAWWSSFFVAGLRLAMAEELAGAPVDRKDPAAVKAALAGVPKWTIHNLRHTAATLMREHLGVSKGIVKLLLAHTGGGGATAIYDRSELLGKRRAALVAWAAWLEELEKGEAAATPTPKVRPIGDRGR